MCLINQLQKIWVQIHVQGGQLQHRHVVGQGKWYSTASIPVRAVTVWAAVVIYRFKYYFAWSVSEAALIFSGFCYNGALHMVCYTSMQALVRWPALSASCIGTTGGSIHAVTCCKMLPGSSASSDPAIA